jgi:hypothetical protein
MAKERYEESTTNLKESLFSSMFKKQKSTVLSRQNRKEKEMRSSLFLSKKPEPGENRPRFSTVPFWVWMALIAFCMLFVLALR